MTMVFDPAPPHALEEIFEDFEKSTGWRLSAQARVILEQGYDAVGSDTLGLGGYAHPSLRPDALAKVIELMPRFLAILGSKAATREKEIGDRVIGGVFVLQNTDEWKAMFGCTCWPI
jgi:hypothetical protein